MSATFYLRNQWSLLVAWPRITTHTSTSVILGYFRWVCGKFQPNCGSTPCGDTSKLKLHFLLLSNSTECNLYGNFELIMPFMSINCEKWLLKRKKCNLAVSHEDYYDLLNTFTYTLHTFTRVYEPHMFKDSLVYYKTLVTHSYSVSFAWNNKRSLCHKVCHLSLNSVTRQVWCHLQPTSV
jgi:hypothetical protein